MNNKTIQAAWVLMVGAAMMQCGTLYAAQPVEHVVIVSIDGLAAYLLDDPKAPLPNLRALAREGAVAERGMTVSNPSVTWPNHTSLISGVRPEKHGVLANGVLVRGGPGVPTRVDPRRDQADLIRVPTLLEAAHAAGLVVAEVNWPCMRGSKSLVASFPDVPEAVTHMTPALRDELISAGILADATDQSFSSNSGARRDQLWTDTACHILHTRRPQLLLVHLLNVDGTHHAEGAQSPAGYTANAFADACLGRIVAALDSAGIRDKSAVIVVADHGFALTPKAILPNVALRQAGLLQTDSSGRITEARAHVFPEGGIGLVYCTDPGSAPDDARQVAELLKGREGVADVLTPAQFARYGLPHPREYSQAPDLVVVAADGYGVSSSAEGDAFIATNIVGRVSLGSHGFISTLPKMNAVCVLSGAGIRRGVRLEPVENIDIAPTVARLLGVPGFQADGKVLADALSP
ncbi:MAG: alkaline phosphatase family protein [Pirellulaceae bacterium]